MQPWTIANPFGILVDAQHSAWHAGRVYDMLTLGAGSILAGTETGGVWHIDGAYNAVPLSDDWDWPDVECLAFGPRSASHVLAGCHGGLYETDPNAPDPLHAWHPVALPPKVSIVYRIAVWPEPARIVLATDRGIWWTGGAAGTAYAWTQASGLAIEAPFFGLARSDRGLIAGVRNSVGKFGPAGIAGVLAGGTVSGLFLGRWHATELGDATDLVLKPAAVGGLTTAQIDAMKYVSVAACRDHPARAYAVSADADGKVLAIHRSTTGGETWDPCAMALEGNHDPRWTVQTMSGQKEQGGWHKTIGVHPTNPDVVGFGWRRALVSKNRGDSWRLMGGDWSDPNTWEYSTPHMHDDVHALHFEPGFTNKRLYILSDGGIVQTQDWDGDPTDFKSAMNRNLANLQFYSTRIRNFWGTLGVADFAPVIGGGLQDNGNVWSGLVSGFWEWQKAEGGDGGWVGCIKHAGGQLLSNSKGEAVVKFSWKNNAFDPDGPVGLVTVFGNVDTAGLKGPVAETIPRPSYRNPAGELMHAVCAPAMVRAADIMSPIPLELDGKDAECRIIFGLFGGDSTSYAYWRDIGRLPPYAATISALGADNGSTIFAGTVDGRIFALSVGAGPPLELTVENPESGKGSITRIVTHFQRGAFAVMQSDTGAYVLELDAFTWRILRGPLQLPFEPIFGLDINRRVGPVTLAASTESAVWVSPDLGQHWLQFTAGLPRRPHCADVRFGVLEGRDVLFVSTYGRSVWMSDLDAKG